MTKTNLIEALEKAEGPRGVIPWEFMPQRNWLKTCRQIKKKPHLRASWREIQRLRFVRRGYGIAAFVIGFWWIIPTVLTMYIWHVMLKPLPWHWLHPERLGTRYLWNKMHSVDMVDAYKNHKIASAHGIEIEE